MYSRIVVNYFSTDHSQRDGDMSLWPPGGLYAWWVIRLVGYTPGGLYAHVITLLSLNKERVHDDRWLCL